MTTLFIMDGITVQHAGELLFDTAATATQRAQCAETYLRSLEDVAFALIFASGLAVTKNLPKVGNETPGSDLCSHFGGWVRPLEESRTAPPDDLVAKQVGRRKVAEWLTGLGCLKRKNYPFWREFALREAGAYLWPGDDSGRALLLRSDIKPADLTFGKNYWVVPELQAMLPQTLVENLAADILTHHRLPRQNALEFIERAIVAHAVIFEWYQCRLRLGAGPEVPLTYLPHVTRTTFVPEDLIDSELWNLQRLIMPRVLAEILRGCDRRADVVRRIEDYIKDGRLECLRRLLQDALLSGDLRELEKIRRDLEQRLDSRKETSLVDFAVKIGWVGLVPKFEMEVRKRGADEESEYEGALKLVLRRSPDVRSELRAEAARVFPELRNPPNLLLQPTGSAGG